MLWQVAILCCISQLLVKKNAWERWCLFSEVTKAFHDLFNYYKAHGNADQSEELVKIIERFIILMYDKASNFTDINKLEKYCLQEKGDHLIRYPHTRIFEKSNAAIHYMWPSAVKSRKTSFTNRMGIVWSNVPISSMTSNLLILCGCKVGCAGR